MCLTCISNRSIWASRRGFLLASAAAAAAPALAQVDVGKRSVFRKLVSADEIEQAAAKQYAKILSDSRAEKTLVSDGHPQVRRLRAIADRIIPHAAPWNSRASSWRWEINLISSKEVNAFCLPGGKIAFYTGILDQLQLTDDEAAMIMGHEMAHALREHASERIGKTQATGQGLSMLSQWLGLGNIGDVVAGIGTQLLTLTFSREDESEADLVGLELAARAGYQPHAGATLWTKMSAASGGGNANLAFLSTHPTGPDRIRLLEQNETKVQGLYERARRGG
jgi:Zn-dependent protease with chaperone function